MKSEVNKVFDYDDLVGSYDVEDVTGFENECYYK